ncbi:MAG: hypothetical protein ACTSXF_15050 [Promethearchaeota archaeon]
MNNYQTILNEDLEAFRKYIKRENLELATIITNRLIENSLLIESKEYTLLGAFLRIHILLLKRIIEEEKKKEKIQEVYNFITNIKDKIDLNIIFNEYFKLYQNLREELIPFEEKEIYKQNLAYSEYSIKYFIKFLIEELKDNLNYFRLNQLFGGILNEIDRISTYYGATKTDLMLYITLNYSGRIFNFFRSLIINDDIDKKEWIERWNIYKKELINNLTIFLEDKDNYFSNSLSLLIKLCKEWRYMFLRISEPISIEFKIHEKPPIPKEINEKISKLITSTIKEEIEDDKND